MYVYIHIYIPLSRVTTLSPCTSSEASVISREASASSEPCAKTLLCETHAEPVCDAAAATVKRQGEGL